MSCTHWRSTAEGEDSKSAACCFDCSSSNVAYENITTSEGAACAEVAGRGWSGSFVVQSSHFRACRFQAPTSMNSDAMAVDEERGAQSTTQCWGTTTTAPFCAARAVTQPLYCPAPRGAAARDNRRRSETTPEHQELSSILNVGHPPSCRIVRLFREGCSTQGRPDRESSRRATHTPPNGPLSPLPAFARLQTAATPSMRSG